MKKTRLMSAFLATAVLSGVIGAVPVIAEEDTVLYTYQNEQGETVNITQSKIDEGHWNVDALEGTAPILYEDFPMSVERFVNDFGELSLDLVYMKNTNDFSNVNLTIENLITGEEVYDYDITEYSFYSPVLGIGESYVLTVTENYNGTETDYKRIVQTKKIDADMPEIIYSDSEEQYILISDVEDLRNSQHIAENGEIIIDARQTNNDRVCANDFSVYCQTLEQDHTYRIYTQYEGEQYMGFIDGSDNDYIYNYGIEVSNYEALYTPNLSMAPTSLTFSEVKNAATNMRFNDYYFNVKDRTSNTSKMAAFRIDLLDAKINQIATSESCNLHLLIKGDSAIGIYLWVEVSDVPCTVTATPEKGTTSRDITINLSASKYGITADDSVSVYGVVYFSSATEGYGMVSADMVSTYTDDVTGSIYEAMQDVSTPGQLTNFTEYKLNGSLDVDVFYLKSIASVYKVSIRNRRLSEQQQLENGILCTGRKEKYIAVLPAYYEENSQATEPLNSLFSYEESVYTIPKNADMSIYCPGSSSDTKYFVSVAYPSFHTITEDEYMISYTIYGDDDIVEG